MTAPIRGARWLVTGTWAWITLKPGSRPRRVARIFLKRVSRWLNDRPRLHARVLRMRRLVPTLERRRVTLAQSHRHGSSNLPSAIPHVWGIDPDPDVRTAWRNIVDDTK
jgi:O-antigen chain-terminating methyltransferase